MKSRKLYGKIYSNAGESFLVDKPAEPVTVVDKPTIPVTPAVQYTEPVKTAEKPSEPVKTVTTSKFKINGEVWNPDGIEMVYVEGGTFTMGCTSEQGDDCEDDEKPAHLVIVSDFYIGKYEVTQAQWKAIMGSNPSAFKGDNLPVEQVSWNDVQEFIRKLNVQTRTLSRYYRLPTEAEWEFAARGGTISRDYMYSGSNTVDNVAWYSKNAGVKTHPVGTKSSNELGIYDMSGNVWEWCSDRKGAYNSNAQINPQGPSSGSSRVYRGGGWINNAEGMLTRYRFSNTTDWRYRDFGFRLACSEIER